MLRKHQQIVIYKKFRQKISFSDVHDYTVPVKQPLGKNHTEIQHTEPALAIMKSKVLRRKTLMEQGLTWSDQWKNKLAKQKNESKLVSNVDQHKYTAIFSRTSTLKMKIQGKDNKLLINPWG